MLLGVVLLALTVLLTGAAVLRAVRQPAPGNGDPAGAAATANTPAAAPSGALPATAATLAPVAGLDRPAASATLRPTPSLMPGPAGGPRVRVSRPSAALYQGPSPDFPVLRRLSEGQLLDVIAATADRTWLNVRLDDDLTGWIETAVVIAVAPADLAAIEVAQTVPAPGTTAEVASPAATAPATATSLPGSTPLPPSATPAPATATAAATTTPPTETPRPSPTETPRPPTETPRPTNTPGLLPSLTPPLPTLPTP